MKRNRSLFLGLVVATLTLSQFAHAALPLSASISAGRTRRGDVMPINVKLYSYVTPAYVPATCIVAGPNLPPRSIGTVLSDGSGTARFAWRVSTSPNVDNNYAYGVAGDGWCFNYVGFYLPHLPIG